MASLFPFFRLKHCFTAVSPGIADPMVGKEL
jgi:hypothetical protein